MSDPEVLDPAVPEAPAALEASPLAPVPQAIPSVSESAEPDYVSQACAARECMITALEATLSGLPPVSSIAREYAETRSDLAFAIHNLKAGRK
jgi:hypothetical protein